MKASMSAASALEHETTLELERLVDEYNEALSQGEAPFDIHQPVGEIPHRDLVALTGLRRG